MLSGRHIKVFSDFDGTITEQDALKILLRTFGPKNWQSQEEKLLRGEIQERQLLQTAFKDFSLEKHEVSEFLNRKIRIDPAFRPFVEWSQRHHVDLQILSGGFEEFIRVILKREALDFLPVKANQVQIDRSGWRVTLSAQPRLCDLCSHCKSSSIQNEILKNPSDTIVYIGDGLSDLCAIQLADLVFAKGYLRTYCEEKKISYIPFDNFRDVRLVLDNLLRPEVVAA